MSKTVIAIWIQNCIGVVLASSAFISLIVNGLIIYVYIKNKQLQQTMHLMILSVCCLDLLRSLTTVPLVSASFLAHRWLYGNVGCKAYGCLVGIFGFSSIALLCSIAVVRWYLVKRSLKTIRPRTGFVIIMICFLYSICWGSFPLVGWGRYDFEAQNISCGLGLHDGSQSVMSYLYSITVQFYIVPVGLIIFSYIQVVRKIKKEMMTARNRSQGSAIRKLKKQKYIITTIVIMIVAFILSWTPYVIVYFWAVFLDSENIHPVILTIPPIIAKMSTIWNAIIYFYRNEVFLYALYLDVPFIRLFFSNKYNLNVNTHSSNSEGKQNIPELGINKAGVDIDERMKCLGNEINLQEVEIPVFSDLLDEQEENVQRMSWLPSSTTDIARL